MNRIKTKKNQHKARTFIMSKKLHKSQNNRASNEEAEKNKYIEIFVYLTHPT